MSDAGVLDLSGRYALWEGVLLEKLEEKLFSALAC
jgi:hypothetical protein